MRAIAALLIAPVALSACATTSGYGAPTDVIRYHLGTDVERGTVIVQAAPGSMMTDAAGNPMGGAAGMSSLADQPFTTAVAREIGAAGYQQAGPGGPTQFIVEVGVRRVSHEERRPSPFSIGIGGGGFSGGRGGGVGLGGGVGFPVGGGRRMVIDSTELSVLIKRRSDQSPVWEGHARSVDRRMGDMQVTADKLARALFAGFPGESGQTVTVR